MRERILLIRLSALGDVVNVLPALVLLRRARPGAHLAFVVEDRNAAVVEGHPCLDEVIVFPRRRWREGLGDPRRWAALVREVLAYRRALAARRFDVTLDFQGNLKGALHAWGSGAPRRIGFARGFDREASHLFATEHVTPPAGRPHRVDKFASLVEPLGALGDAREYVLPSSSDARARIDRWLASLTPPAHLPRAPAPRMVLLHPGTSASGAAKRWPADRFGELARRLADLVDVRVVVTWGPGEEGLARAVCERASGAAELGPRTESLLDLVELLCRAAVFVGADTGPMHLAAAVGTPCVALFGPKDPAVYAPYGPGHRVVRPGDPAGSGDATTTGKPTTSPAPTPARRAGPMEAIAVDAVLGAVMAQLAVEREPPLRG